MPTPEIAPDAMVALQSYEWPGNVRQLRNVVERTVILAPGDRIGRIDLDLLPPEVLGRPADNGGGMGTSAIMGAPLKEARESFEREYLRVQIRRFGQHLAHRQLHRHGALGAAPQAEAAGDHRQPGGIAAGSWALERASFVTVIPAQGRGDDVRT